MQITLITIGKTDSSKLNSIIDDYIKRLGHYVKFKFEIIPDLKRTKNLSEIQQKKLEGESIIKKLKPSDILILLDESGKQYSSIGFSKYLQKQMNAGVRNLVFVIGGPYGFSEELYGKSKELISLSKMTFSHQMIRLFFVEQLYRGFTILKNEPYHHT